MYLIEKYLLSKKGYKNVLDVLNKINGQIDNISMDKAQIVTLERLTNQLSGKLKKMKSRPENDLEAAGDSIERRMSRGVK
jgi:hypothetical protein